MRLLLFSIIASCSAGGLLFAQATTENQSPHNYDPLEQVLAAYPPGFKAQWILHTDP